jgi:hypothetical protein
MLLGLHENKDKGKSKVIKAVSVFPTGIPHFFNYLLKYSLAAEYFRYSIRRIHWIIKYIILKSVTILLTIRIRTAICVLY